MIVWIEANAGSGKTTRLIEHIHHLLQQKGVNAAHIVCLTYTRLAASEIQHRLRERGVWPQPRVETLHSFCWQELQMPPHTHILDHDAQRACIEESIEALFAYCEKTDGPLQHARSFLRRHVRDTILIESLISWLMDFPDLMNTLEAEGFVLPPLPEIKSYDTHQAHLYLTQEGHKRKNVKDKAAQEIFWQHYQTYIQAMRAHLHTHFLALAWALKTIYAMKKEQRDAVDYQDILKLTQQQGQPISTLHHLLVDEAQDLSTLEWQIIELLTQPFFTHPIGFYSLFVVGDIKQSIFSFQGACPKAFLAHKTYFQHKAQEVCMPWQEEKLTRSFRSAPQLLTFVDAVTRHFNPTIFNQHHEAEQTHAGIIELWPIDSTAEQLCQRVVNTIECLNIAPWEIFILFHTRNRLWNFMNQTLADAGLLRHALVHEAIGEKASIQVALACAHCALNPYDDAHLARVLTSPLIGMTDHELLTLAHQRKGSLWPLVQQKPKLAPLMNALDACMPPSLFFSTLAQIWPISDLDLLIDQTFIFETMYPPSLELFLAWIPTRISPIKQDAHPQDVRLMTIHAAKGLEARAVFLPDTLSPPTLRQCPRLFEADPFIWDCEKKYHDAPIQKAKENWLQKEQEEYQRLLYVALTRAKEALYIGAWGGPKPPPESWYVSINEGYNIVTRETI